MSFALISDYQLYICKQELSALDALQTQFFANHSFLNQVTSRPTISLRMRIFLAPMEGVIDHHFRAIYSEIGGIDVCVSEFVRVNDLALTDKFLLRECPELKANYRQVNTAGHTEGGTPVRLQLLGSNPETLAETAASAAKLGAPAIDLNFGCPAKTVNKSMGGAILLQDARKLHNIVTAVRRAVPLTIPVTAKVRLGFGKREGYVDNALAIAEAGASEICVHARSQADKYNPPAYWHCIAEIRKAISIPVIANGEIWNIDHWQQCQRESGCNDFMLGRGLIACPDLALQIKAHACNDKSCDNHYQIMTWEQVTGLLYRFYCETRDDYPVRFLGNRVKQWLFYLSMHYPQAKVFFDQIKRHKHPEQFEQAFRQAGVNIDDSGDWKHNTQHKNSILTNAEKNIV